MICHSRREKITMMRKIMDITKAKLVIEKLKAKLAIRRAERAPKKRIFQSDFENKK